MEEWKVREDISEIENKYTAEKVDKVRIWFFEKINEIINS